MRKCTITYWSCNRKHKYELIYDPQKQPNRIFTDEKLVKRVTLVVVQHQCINLELN